MQIANKTDLIFMADRLRELSAIQKLHKKQQEVVQAMFGLGKKKVFCRKGRKGGGTEVTLYCAIRLCGTQKNKTAYIIYPDNQVLDKVLDKGARISTQIPKEWNAKVRWTAVTREVYFPLSNSRLIFCGAHQYQSMVGFEFDFCAFDELKDHDPRAYQNCYPNMISRDAIWMVTGAPPINKHNFYVKIEEEAMREKDTWSYHKWNLYDNTFLPASFDIEYEKKAHYARGESDIWLVEWEAEYIYGGSRSVLKGFSKERHAYDITILKNYTQFARERRELRWFVLYDPGYAKCFAALLCSFNPSTLEKIVWREIYETDRNKATCEHINIKLIQFAEDLAIGHEPLVEIYDSAAPGFAIEMRKLRPHASFVPCFKQADDEEKYFRRINEEFTKDRLRISTLCHSTIFEIENYTTDDNGNYPDAHNHTLDLLRYFVKYVENKGNDATRSYSNLTPIVRNVEEEMIAELQKYGYQINKPKIDWPML